MMARLEPIAQKATDSTHATDLTFQYHDKLQGNQLVMSGRVRILKSGSFYLISAESLPVKSGEQLDEGYTDGKNSKYEFKLGKPAERTEWLLLDWKLTNEEKPNYKSITYKPWVLYQFEHLSLGYQALHHLVNHKDFRLVSTEMSPDISGAVRVAFEYKTSPRPGSTTDYTMRKGWMDLDPKGGWCIKKAKHTHDLTIGGKTILGEVDRSFDYIVNRDGIPILTQIRNEKTEKDSAGKVTRDVVVTSKFSTKYSDSISEHEFTLTAFGLPEPMGVEPLPRRTPRYVWFLAIAGGCALFAVLFRRLARRRSAVAPS